jgi:hypothetical protein
VGQQNCFASDRLFLHPFTNGNVKT